MTQLKRYFFTGLLAWVPLSITLWVVYTLVRLLDSWILLLPTSWQPSHWLVMLLPEAWQPGPEQHFYIPGIGLLIVVGVVLLTGIITANFLGAQLLHGWETLLQRIPVIKSIYGSVKQVSDTLLADSGNAFRQALLVRFPHSGAWTVAFQTGIPGDAIQAQIQLPARQQPPPDTGHALPHPVPDEDISADEYVSVYVPTTPNPTSGYLLLVRKSDTRPLAMSVQDALKYVVSMGVISAASGGKHAVTLASGTTPQQKNRQ